jgi:hypothetical protein
MKLAGAGTHGHGGSINHVRVIPWAATFSTTYKKQTKE